MADQHGYGDNCLLYSCSTPAPPSSQQDSGILAWLYSQAAKYNGTVYTDVLKEFFDSGQISLTTQQSCVDFYCHSSRDINTPGSLNYLHVTTTWGAQGSDGGHAGFIGDLHGTDSIVNFGGSIHGTVGLDISPQGKISFQFAGTKYPSVEAYQYLPGSPDAPKNLGTSLESPNNYIGPMIGLHDASRRLNFVDGVQSQDPNLVFLNP